MKRAEDKGAKETPQNEVLKKENVVEISKPAEISQNAQKSAVQKEKPSQSKTAFMIVLSLFLILFGCCVNYFFLELMVREDRSCSSFVSFFQFCFIVLEGISFQIDFNNIKEMLSFKAKELRILKPRKIPFSYHLFLVVIFYSQAWTSGLPMSFGISMTLHAIFRSGTLVMNMITGKFLFKMNYNIRQVASVIFVTIGIILGTMASRPKNSSKSNNSETDFSQWLIGLAILMASQVLSACLGHFQHDAFEKYGDDWRQNMFYSHALSLPFFLMQYKSFGNHLSIFNNSAKIQIIPGIYMPKLWSYLIINVVCQYLCIQGVFILNAFSSSLTVNLATTIRKFISLLFSMWYFQNPWTKEIILSMFFVFGGTFVYSLPNKKKAPVQKKIENEQKIEEKNK